MKTINLEFEEGEMVYFMIRNGFTIFKETLFKPDMGDRLGWPVTITFAINKDSVADCKFMGRAKDLSYQSAISSDYELSNAFKRELKNKLLNI